MELKFSIEASNPIYVDEVTEERAVVVSWCTWGQEQTGKEIRDKTNKNWNIKSLIHLSWDIFTNTYTEQKLLLCKCMRVCVGVNYNRFHKYIIMIMMTTIKDNCMGCYLFRGDREWEKRRDGEWGNTEKCYCN